MLAILAGGASLAFAFAGGPPASRTGAPVVGGIAAEPNCTQCHNTFLINTPGATLEILDAPASYVPGTLYTLRVRMTSTFAPPRRWGFQITAVREGNGQGSGTWNIVGHPEIQIVNGAGAYATRSYVEHLPAGTLAGQASSIEWTFRWQAPATNEGRTFFFAAGNAADSSGNKNGDHIYTATATTDYDCGAPACLGDAYAGLTGSLEGSAAWGDYDGDGDLDLVVTGHDASLSSIIRLYHNEGGANPTITSVATSLPNLVFGSTAWGDYDGDGDLDLLMTGSTDAGSGLTIISRIYRNSGGATPSFSDIGAGLAGVTDHSTAAWGDYDGDGDLDIVMYGRAQNDAIVSKLYRSSGGINPTFTEVVGALPFGVYDGAVAWGDYDNDGDLDILITGVTPGIGGQRARLLRNSGGANPTFTDVPVGLLGVSSSSAAWGDYDNDGDLDILITGQQGATPSATVYENSGGADPTFTDIGAGLAGVEVGSGAWGDYDNDGYLDIAIAGADNSGRVAKVYRSQGGPHPTFVDAGFPMTGVQWSSVAWGDYDNDGDLDLLIAGSSSSSGAGALTTLYRNHSVAPVNAPPTAPSNLHPRLVSGTTVEFTWDAASDAQTPASGLSYNLRIGTTPGGSQISPAMANGADGYRRIPALGNTNERLSSVVTFPAVSTYYWSVQAVDGGWVGSAFAPEQTADLSVLGVGDGAEPPSRFALGHATPNPFLRSTSMRFDLPRSERVRLEVFDPVGRRVRTLVSREIGAGRHEVVWDGADERGRRVGAGIYLYRIVAGSFSATRRVVLLP